MTQDPKDAVGQVIASRYELLEAIGRGGHGVVWRARDKTEGQFVAVKMLNDVTTRDPQYAERLAREQQAMLALSGTSAVALLDMCRADNGALCLVMELLEGVDLEARFEQLEQADERMPIDELVALLEPIVATLDRAHEAGIIHRDIKPANIFLLSDGGVRLLDFGLARLKEAQPLTAIGTIMGSPSYIAPEVWKGQPQLIDHRADLYSLGVIAFRALSGELPFGGNSLFDKYVQATSAPRPSLRARRPELLPEVDAWVREALAVDPAARFATARRLWDALLAALRHSVPPQQTEQAPDGISAARAFVDAAKPRAIAAWRAAARVMRRWTSAEPEPGEAAPAVPPLNAENPATEPEPVALVPAHPVVAGPTKTVVVPPDPAEPKTLLYVPGAHSVATAKTERVAPARAASRLPKLPVPPAPRTGPDAPTVLKASFEQAPAPLAPAPPAKVTQRRPKLPNLPPPPRPAASAPSSPAPAVQKPAERAAPAQGTVRQPAQRAAPAQQPEAPTLLKLPAEAYPSASAASSPSGNTEAPTLLRHPVEARPSTSAASRTGEDTAPKSKPAPQPAAPVAPVGQSVRRAAPANEPVGQPARSAAPANEQPARAAAAQPAQPEKHRATRRGAPKNDRAKEPANVPASPASSRKRQRSKSRKGKARATSRKRGSGKKR